MSHDFFLVFGAILGAGAVCFFLLALFAQERAPLVLIGLSTAVFAATSMLLWALFRRRAKRNGLPLE